MKINTVYEQGDWRINEDQLFVWDNLFAVFDGATSLNKFINPDWKTWGYLASLTAKEIFANSEKGKSLDELIALSNKKISEIMNRHNVDRSKAENRWSTWFAAVRINWDILEWSQIADCIILIINEDNSYKLLIEDYDLDKEIMIEWKNLWNISKNEKLKIIFSKIIELKKKQNIDYWVLNGEDNFNNLLRSWTVNLKWVKHILLFTDWLIPLNENPEQNDNFSNFVKDFLEKWLLYTKEKQRILEDLDPECNKYPRYKRHDDIAAISISL